MTRASRARVWCGGGVGVARAVVGMTDVRGWGDEVGVFALDTRTPYLFRGKVFD